MGIFFFLVTFYASLFICKPSLMIMKLLLPSVVAALVMICSSGVVQASDGSLTMKKCGEDTLVKSPKREAFDCKFEGTKEDNVFFMCFQAWGDCHCGNAAKCECSQENQGDCYCENAKVCTCSMKGTEDKGNCQCQESGKCNCESETGQCCHKKGQAGNFTATAGKKVVVNSDGKCPSNWKDSGAPTAKTGWWIILLSLLVALV